MDRGRSQAQPSQVTGWGRSKTIIIKLKKRVKVGASTLLIKVKTHHGDPLNEEADRGIRSEMGRLKEETHCPESVATKSRGNISI